MIKYATCELPSQRNSPPKTQLKLTNSKTRSIHSAPYRVRSGKHQIERDRVEEMKKDWLPKSKTMVWAQPDFWTAKKDGGIWIYVDCRLLNLMTLLDIYVDALGDFSESASPPRGKLQALSPRSSVAGSANWNGQRRQKMNSYASNIELWRHSLVPFAPKTPLNLFIGYWMSFWQVWSGWTSRPI